MRRSVLEIGTAALLLGSGAHAQTSWMVPRTPVVASALEAHDIPVSLFVGDDFVAGEERAFEPSEAARLILLHGGQSVALPSTTKGAIPFAHVPIQVEGGYLLILDRSPAVIERPASTFEEYLRREGQGAVLSERARRGETASPGRERITECLKAFIEVGNGRDEAFDRSVGQRLELIPGNDPVLMKPGRTLQVLVQFRDVPLAGARVDALSRVGADVRSKSYTTDEHGMVYVQIDRPALWLMRLVHVVRCEGCKDADWDSTWASYVFASGGPDRGTVTAPAMAGARSGGGWIAAGLIATVLADAAALFGLRRSHRR